MKFGSLTITTGDGRTREYPIDLPSLVVGRADSNNIVIDDLSVARRHARLVVDSGRLMVEDLGSSSGTFIGGDRIPVNTLSLVGDDHTIRFGDVEAVFNPPSGETATAAPVAVAPGLPLQAPTAATVAPAADGPLLLRAVLTVPPTPLQPGDTPGTAQLQVMNRGRVVDELFVVVDGLPIEWIKIGIPRLILRPGEQADVPIEIAPPRRSDARAGLYDFTVRVTSRETGREAIANGQVTVLPFDGTKLSLQPVRSKRNFKLMAENEGNALATYALSGTDDEESFGYQFSAPSIELPPGDKASLPFKVNSNKHALFGKKEALPFTVVATPTTDRGEKTTVEGQLTISPPLEPLKRPAMFAALLLVVALGALVLFFLPQDNEAKATTTEDAYAGVHLCDKDGKQTDAVKKELAAATSTTTSSGASIPKGSNASGGPYFAQNDPRWANDEYAKAKDPDFGPDWCGTTIQQCGCAMTSVTTVMALYNILTMPDGSDLTPQTVNNWFNGNARKTARGWVSQGYIYGDVIWTAANQLSGEIAKIKPGSPTIKFSRTGTGSDEEIRTELKAGRPVVLEVPGHWISAVGIDDQGKILINDPFYRDRKTLDAYAGKVKSSVLFEASDDLSAVVITVPADERVRVTNVKTGDVVGTLNTGSQDDAKNAAKVDIPGASYSARTGWRDPTCIASPPPPGSGTNQIVLPGSRDDYKVEVLDTSGGTASVAIHTYDKSGEPSVTTLDNAGSVVANLGYDPSKDTPQVQQLDETPQADSSSDRVAGKTPTPAGATATATVPATTTPEATPTQGPVTTILSLSVSPGAKVVNIGSNLGFGLGDTIRFSPGASNEEDNTIVGFGSFILAAPLKYAHSAGEPIVRIAGVPGGGAPPPATSTDIPPPDGVKLDCSPIFSATPRQATLICSATISGTYTTTRWTIDGRVQSQFSGQTIVVTVFSQDATTAIAVSACNVTVCVSNATTQAIRFPVSPNQPQVVPTATVTPVVTPPPAPPATGLAASCSVTITTNPDATIKCQPLTTVKNFTSITWDAPALAPSSGRPSPDGAPFVRVVTPADLTPDKTGNANVLLTATMCTAPAAAATNAANCTVSPPATVSIPYATTSLSVLPATVNLGNSFSLFAVIKGPVVPDGGVVRFVATRNGVDTPLGLDEKVQIFPGFAFAQATLPTGGATLNVENADYEIRAVYGGATNTFGGTSDPVTVHINPHIDDVCNSLDDNGNGLVDEAGTSNCNIVGDTSGGILTTSEDAGGGTTLSGVTVNLPSDVNASGQKTYRAGPNQTIDVSLDASRQATTDGTDPYCANCVRQVYLGIGGNTAVTPPVAPAGPVCALNKSLKDFPSTDIAKFTFTNNLLKTPSAPGLYYLRATSSLQSSCGQPDVGPPDKSIARIAVKGPTQISAPAITRPGTPPATVTNLGDHVTLSAQVTYPASSTVQADGFVLFCDRTSGPGVTLVPPTSTDPCGGGRPLQTVPVTTVVVNNAPTRQGVLDFDTNCFYVACDPSNPVVVSPFGPHTITAAFLDGASYPNPYFMFSTSSTTTLDIGKALVTTQVFIGQSPVNLGDTVALTASVSSGSFGPFSGTVQFFDGTTAVGGTQTVSGAEIGVATLALDTSLLYPGSGVTPVGSHTFTAVFSGGGNYAATPNPAGGSVISGVLTVNRAIPTIALSLASNTAALGDNVVLTATLGPVNVSSGKFGSFSGAVHFKVGTTELPNSPVCVTTPPTSVTLTLDTGTFYSVAAASSPLGAHAITAQYTTSGCGSTGNYADSDANAAPSSKTLTISAATTTTTVTNTSDPAPRLGGSFTINAAITGAGFGALNGTVRFVEGSSELCSTTTITANAAGGTASCLADTSVLFPGPPAPVGTHAIVARFEPGGGNYAASESPTPFAITVSTVATSVAFTSPSTAQLGANTSLSATVSGTSFGSFSGTVDFKDGTTVIASGAVNSTGHVTAAVDWSKLPAPRVGTHNIVADYGGGGNYAAAVSTSSPMGVTAANITFVLTANPATVVGSQSVTFTASVSGAFGPPAGTVTLTATNGGVAVTLSPSSGALTPNGANDSKVDIPVSGLPPGTTTVTATLAANGDYVGDSDQATVNAVAPTITTLTAPSSLVSPARATLTATVTCPSCGGTTVTGTVVFVVNGTALSGSGPFQTDVSPWVVGSNTVLARFQGTASYAPSDSAPATVQVKSGVSTTVTLGSAGPIDHASSLRISATVTGTAPGTGIVGDGTVHFMNGTTEVGTGQVSGGQASMSLGATDPIWASIGYGTQNFSAHYVGDPVGSYVDSVSGAEFPDSIAILAPTQVILTLPSDSPPIAIATVVQLKATVSCSGACTGSPGNFSGTVQFFADGTAMAGTVTFDAATGVATLDVPANTFTAGQHSITATFTPVANGNYKTSTSSASTIHFQ